jgi:hypothetical protein
MAVNRYQLTEGIFDSLKEARTKKSIWVKKSFSKYKAVN